jgi:hypothetical protein
MQQRFRSPLPPIISFGRRSAGSKSWTDRLAGISRMQPTDIRPLTNMRQRAALPSTIIPPVTALPPSLQTPSSTAVSRLPRLRPDPRQLLSSSHKHTVFTAGNNELDDLSHETMLQDLSEYITKDGDYAITRGGFGEIWKCTFHIDRTSVKVRLQCSLSVDRTSVKVRLQCSLSVDLKLKLDRSQ